MTGSQRRIDGAADQFPHDQATDGRGEGLGGVDIAVGDKAGAEQTAKAKGLLDGDVVTIAGTRFRLV